MAAGITFQLPRGRDVGPLSFLSGRARLCLLVAVARLVGCWCFWLVCPWCWFVGLCFVCFPFRGRRPKDRHFSKYSPLSSGSSVPCIRSHASAGHLVVYFVTAQMVGDRRFPGASILGGGSLHLPPTIPCQSRRLVPNLVMDSLSSLFWTSVRSTRSVAASFLTRCRTFGW